MPVVDLHAHTKYSDGTTTPAELTHAYLKAGVELMSITDHDTTAAVAEGAARAAAAGVLFVPGVEISTKEHDYLHILGYGVDINDAAFAAFLEGNRGNRLLRVKKIIKKLQDYGLALEEADVMALIRATPSRAHVADALRRKGIVTSRHEAFRQYLVEGKPGHVPAPGYTAAEVIERINAAGGKAFIAHPGVVKDIWDFEGWTAAGLAGVEVYYPSHSADMRAELLYIAKKHNLLVSAGSDYHGDKSGRPARPGMQVPHEVFESLKAALCK